MTRVLRAVTVSSAVLGAVALVYIALATIASVVLRYVFRQPDRFLFDSTEFALALTVFLVFGFVAMHDGNVRVDLIPKRFTRAKHVAGIVARFGTSIIAAAFAWFAVQIFVNDLSTGIRMGSTFGLPRWVLMLGLLIGLVLLTLNELVNAIVLVKKGATAEEAEEASSGGE